MAIPRSLIRDTPRSMAFQAISMTLSSPIIFKTHQMAWPTRDFEIVVMMGAQAGITAQESSGGRPT